MQLVKLSVIAALALLSLACVPPAAQPTQTAAAAPQPPSAICYMPQTYEWAADSSNTQITVNPHCAEGFTPSVIKLVEPGIITAVPRCCPSPKAAAPVAAPVSGGLHALTPPAPAPRATPAPAPVAPPTAPAPIEVPKTKEKTK